MKKSYCGFALSMLCSSFAFAVLPLRRCVGSVASNIVVGLRIMTRPARNCAGGYPAYCVPLNSAVTTS